MFLREKVAYTRLGLDTLEQTPGMLIQWKMVDAHIYSGYNRVTIIRLLNSRRCTIKAHKLGSCICLKKKEKRKPPNIRIFIWTTLGCVPSWFITIICSHRPDPSLFMVPAQPQCGHSSKKNIVQHLYTELCSHPEACMTLLYCHFKMYTLLVLLEQ